MSFILTLTMALSLLPTVTLTASAQEGPWTGSGTQDDPYQISSKEDLWALSNYSNSGANLTGMYFKQTEDITFDEGEE